jgi:hypothetical protein
MRPNTKTNSCLLEKKILTPFEANKWRHFLGKHEARYDEKIQKHMSGMRADREKASVRCKELQTNLDQARDKWGRKLENVRAKLTEPERNDGGNGEGYGAVEGA